MIGTGAFGEALLYEYRGALVVVKRMCMSNESLLRDFISECNVMRRVCRHPCIVPFFGANYDHEQQYAYIVTEYMQGGSVENALI